MTTEQVRFPTLVNPVDTLITNVEGLSARRATDADSLIITKTVPGFSPDIVGALRGIVREAADARLGAIKYIVFDLAHDAFALSTAAEGFVDLLADLESLILAAPTVSVAFARADLAGADLEFALACSMMVSERGRRFSFAGDPLVSVGAYALLAQKVGFVRAERLMEGADIVDAETMYDLCLLREILADDSTVDEFLAGALRKHNASYGIYRAQRIATGSVHETLKAANMA